MNSPFILVQSFTALKTFVLHTLRISRFWSLEGQINAGVQQLNAVWPIVYKKKVEDIEASKKSMGEVNG